ncbi:MAG: GreA/GreB family elongation factor, partial [Oscillospiraceae bacterium]
DPRNNKISDESAVGKALFGKKAGKTVEIETPVGITKYKIVSISR